VPVTGDDHERLLPDEREKLAVFEGTRCFLRVDDGKCAALTAIDGRLICTIYERRPRVCRDLERGGGACLHEREKNRARAVLRPTTEADVASFFEHQRDSRGHRMAGFTSWDPTDREAFTGRWRRILADPTVVPRTVLLDGAVVGHILKWERSGTPEVTYWISPDHWGKGLATQALRLLLREVTVRPIYGAAAADNVASIHVLEKCGFVPVFRERGFAGARGEEIEEIILRLN
jgi:RimJ/RimL family protein N-acetyltransferase